MDGEGDRPAGRPPVPERAGHAGRAGDQPGDGALHVDLDARSHRAVLERPDHLEAGPVTDMGEARVRVAAERPLQDAAVRRAVEYRTPILELAHAVGRFLRVQLGHARVVQLLAADHRVPEMDLPRVGGRDMRQRRGDAALGHHRVRLAEQRLAHQPDVRTGILRCDRCPESGPARPDHEDVVRARLWTGRFDHRRRRAPRVG